VLLASLDSELLPYAQIHRADACSRHSTTGRARPYTQPAAHLRIAIKACQMVCGRCDADVWARNAELELLTQISLADFFDACRCVHGHTQQLQKPG
jgi:hypothetical protein